jgi:hypothetical protein
MSKWKRKSAFWAIFEEADEEEEEEEDWNLANANQMM